MREPSFSFSTIQSVEELKTSLDSLSESVRNRLFEEIRFVLIQLSREQEDSLARVAC